MGCHNVFNLEEVELPADGGGTSGDAADGSVACYGMNTSVGFFSYCPQGPEVLDPWPEDSVVETGGAFMDCEISMEAAGGDICLIVAESISIAGTVETRGGRPLILLATKGLTITGVLRADSTGINKGPGLDPLACNGAGTPNGESGTNMNPGGGGGAGGSFGTVGQHGGLGGGQNLGGMAGAAAPDVVALRGGCTGGTGGIAYSLSGTRPRGGPGGGAVYLIAGQQIAITNGGIINASGGGGEGASVQSAPGGGGGGGGAGGMIVLDAPRVVLDGGAAVIARGGGGGGGGCSTTAGQPGEGAVPANYTTGGGMGGAGGAGTGGVGAAASVATYGQDGVAGCGGGGGGGGYGVIRIATPNFMNLSSTISPMPQM